ncbi:MAG: UDP-N-acetylglucosamine--N-acetylmuramyl-(pentapeptide) pyrophosphoryl-undecaprenol N-acetylglucosamine transferase [Candidatus Moduliflexus flocculans]|nr:UDP-N-acetylglucosamine--N-acetylmuramyl-(pentapeptide) pyrophosphoryl-undecaprenol N-acetylglucosamine transferase [Candidatus Moduliflexus flocculans]
MAEALQYLVDLRQNIQFLHQTGERDHKVVTESYRRLSFQGIVVPFIYQMAEAYTLADLVVSRSGATALAEITAVGKASILVPYPFAAAHHQEFNARKLQDMGAARLILQKDLDGKVLARGDPRDLSGQGTPGGDAEGGQGLRQGGCCGEDREDRRQPGEDEKEDVKDRRQGGQI